MRYTKRSRFTGQSARRHGGKPARQWVGLTVNNTTTAGVGASRFELLSFEAPAITVGTPLTADPPEDQILDRVLCSWSITASAAQNFDLGLILVDRTWTPVGTTSIVPDLDKRWLWWRGNTAMLANDIWRPNLLVQGSGAGTGPNSVPVERDISMVDISPKVKMEDGKALVLVVYQSLATATTTFTGQVRLLMHRAGRR